MQHDGARHWEHKVKRLESLPVVLKCKEKSDKTTGN